MHLFIDKLQTRILTKSCFQFRIFLKFYEFSKDVKIFNSNYNAFEKEPSKALIVRALENKLKRDKYRVHASFNSIDNKCIL